MNPKTAPTVASAHRLRSLFRWAGITATALSCSMAPPLTGAARGQDPASWPTVALPTGLDTFSVGQDMINNGTPMRVQGFVSRRSQADLLNWFRQHWPAPLVETTQGQQQVLGRGQGGYYITVQIEAAGRDSQGSRGLVAIADLQGMKQQRPRHESAQQAWLQRWPSGTRVLSQVSTHEDGRNATHRVMSNSQSLHGNRQTLIELMRQDGYALEAPSAKPTKPTDTSAPQVLHFKGPGREALAVLSRAADGASAVVLNTVVHLPPARP